MEDTEYMKPREEAKNTRTEYFRRTHLCGQRDVLSSSFLTLFHSHSQECDVVCILS